jgi:membrane-bound metal-dependent hydrolase YbcI (DUF457 family)
MPDYETHEIVGIVATGLVMEIPAFILGAGWLALPIILAGFAAAFGSFLPDGIDQYKKWGYKHRNAGHLESNMNILRILGIISYLLVWIFWITKIEPYLAIFSLLFGLILGYWMHLLLDSKTPMGLPKHLAGEHRGMR